MIVFYSVVFGISISLTLLHVCHPIRRIVSGVDDRNFNALIKSDRKLGFRIGYLGRFIHCPVCVGFWVAFLFMKFIENENIVDSVMMAFSSVAVNLFLWVVLKRLGVDNL